MPPIGLSENLGREIEAIPPLGPDLSILFLDFPCQGAPETRNMLHPSTHRALMYLQNGHSRG